MNVYIKPTRKIRIAEQAEITIKNVSEVYCENSKMQRKIEEMTVLKIDSEEKDNFLVSVLDIIKKINKIYPDFNIINIGESETLVDFAPIKKTDSKIIKFLKVSFVSLTMFAGSATAIMSYHNESGILKVFEGYNKIFFDGSAKHDNILNISYSLGLFFGITIFFNHFFNKKITKDPTPIEVELSTYQNSVTDTIVDLIGEDNENGGES